MKKLIAVMVVLGSMSMITLAGCECMMWQYNQCLEYKCTGDGSIRVDNNRNNNYNNTINSGGYRDSTVYFNPGTGAGGGLPQIQIPRY